MAPSAAEDGDTSRLGLIERDDFFINFVFAISVCVKKDKPSMMPVQITITGVLVRRWAYNHLPLAHRGGDAGLVDRHRQGAAR